MKIIVKSEIGREVNPKAYQKFFCDTWTKITNGICIDLTKCDCEEYRLFEQSVTTYPAPGISDGEHEAELYYEGCTRGNPKYMTIAYEVYERWKREHEPKVIWNVRAVYRLSPSLKEAEVKQDGWIKVDKVDELLELQKEDIKAWLHRCARDFGGISYSQIDQFIDDYRILDYHKPPTK